MSNNYNFTIEEYYSRIMPVVNLVEAYLGDSEIKNIIFQCRLKPYMYYTNFRAKLQLRRHWIDEFGNSLILEKKRLKIVENDLTLNKKTIKHTDLYYGLSIDQVAKISSLAYLSIGRDEMDLKEVKIVSLLGIDNYLRTYVEYSGEWSRISSLSLGISNLRKIVKNEDIKTWKKLNNDREMVIPCTDKDEWLVSLPIKDRFWLESKLEKQQFNVLEE